MLVARGLKSCCVVRDARRSAIKRRTTFRLGAKWLANSLILRRASIPQASRTSPNFSLPCICIAHLTFFGGLQCLASCSLHDHKPVRGNKLPSRAVQTGPKLRVDQVLLSYSMRIKKIDTANAAEHAHQAVENRYNSSPKYQIWSITRK